MIALVRYNKSTDKQFQEQIAKRHIAKGWILQYYPNTYNDRLTMRYSDIKQVTFKADANSYVLEDNEGKLITIDQSQIDSMAIYNKENK